jgi:hypothetical protein
MSKSVNRASEVWDLIKPFAVGWFNSVMSQAKGEDTGSDPYAIILYDESQQKKRAYSYSPEGLVAALAAAASGDRVYQPPGTIAGGDNSYMPGAEISNGALNVKSSAITEISGLTPGALYAIEGYGGPWYYFAGFAEWTYEFSVSADGTAFTEIGRTFNGDHLTAPAWAEAIEHTEDNNHARLYFRPTGSSIFVKIGDSSYGDNHGAMNWRLAGAAHAQIITVPAGVELVGLGKNSIIDGSIVNEGILTNIRVTGSITGSGICRLVANPDAEVFSGQIQSAVADGTAPLVVASTTVVTNFNADLLDGKHADELSGGGSGGQDWNRNGVTDNAEMLAETPAGLFRRIDQPMRVIVANQRAILSNVQELGLPDATNPIIPCGAAGQSDNKIREISNILYEPLEASHKYKILYTGYNAGNMIDEKIHYAFSEDGKSWTKYASNPVIAARAEDPYLLRVGDTYYCYVEDKANQGANGRIRRYSSSDCITWADDGQITGLGQVQSPVVWMEGNTWYLLYEQYPDAAPDICLATSTDGLAWTDEVTNPVMVKTDTDWVQGDLVPDDIIKIGPVYFLTYHGYSTPTGNPKSGFASSTDLLSWTDSAYSPITPVSPYLYSRTMSFCFDGDLSVFFYQDDDDGICRGFPVLADSTTKTIGSGAVTVDKDFHVVAAESGTADDLVTISGGVAGQLLVLRADSGDTITVKRTGNIALNGEVDFSLSGDKSLLLVYDGTVWSDTGAGGGAGAALTIEDLDGTPSVANVDIIKVTNGTLTDHGDGSVTLDFGSAATDGSAIHDNMADEIAALPEKVSPANGDLILIEDSADSNSKKKVQICNLPGSGGGGSYLLVDEGFLNLDAWAVVAGTWSVGGNILRKTNAGVARLRLNTEQFIGNGVLEVDFRFPTDVLAGPGVLLYWDGANTNNPIFAYASRNPTGNIWNAVTQKWGVSDYATVALSPSFVANTWYTLRIDTAGGMVTTFVDNVRVLSCFPNPTFHPRYVGLGVQGGSSGAVDFRNFRVWKWVLP